MGGMEDWAGSLFACNGHFTSACPPNSKKIMSKYKPIAPKPSLMTSVRCESLSNSMYGNALNPNLIFTPLKPSNCSERSNRKRRRATDFCNSPSPRVARKTKAPSSPDCLGSKRNPVGKTVPTSIVVGRPKIEHPLDGCLDVDKLSVVKDLGFIERGSSSLGNRSLCDKESCVFGKELKLNMGEVVIQSPSKSMETTPIQAMQGDPECGVRFGKCLVFPSDIQKHQKEEKNWRNLVTLPLLPETSRDSDVGSCVPSSTSNSDASYDKEVFGVRIFGKDFSR